MSDVLSDSALDEKLAPAARVMAVLAAGMALGVLLFVAVDAFVYRSAIDRAPTLESLRTINLLTTLVMGCMLAASFVSEALWRARLRAAAEENFVAELQTAFIIRTAVRESAALFGVVVALLAAMGGVLRLYPAYWANLVPAALFLSYLWAHWPTVENLKAELDAVLGG